jgi:hypothetical protein
MPFNRYVPNRYVPNRYVVTTVHKSLAQIMAECDRELAARLARAGSLPRRSAARAT